MSPATPELDLRGNVSLVCLMPCQELTDICSHFPRKSHATGQWLLFVRFFLWLFCSARQGLTPSPRLPSNSRHSSCLSPLRAGITAMCPPNPAQTLTFCRTMWVFFHLPCVYMVCACVYVRIHVHVCVGALACTRLCRSQRLTSGVFNHLHNLLVWSCFEIESHYVTLSCLKVAE